MKKQVWFNLTPYQKGKLKRIYQMAIEENEEGAPGAIILQPIGDKKKPHYLKGGFIRHEQAARIKEILDKLP